MFNDKLDDFALNPSKIEVTSAVRVTAKECEWPRSTIQHTTVQNITIQWCKNKKKEFYRMEKK